MKLRTQRAVVAEYHRVERLCRAAYAARDRDARSTALWGAQQALSWALDNNAMAPSRALGGGKPREPAAKAVVTIDRASLEMESEE